MRIDSYEVQNDRVVAVYVSDERRNMKQFRYEQARPRGEWIVIHNALGETKYKCNQCQHYVKPSGDKKFCPNCGADMRKKEGGAE